MGDKYQINKSFKNVRSLITIDLIKMKRILLLTILYVSSFFVLSCTQSPVQEETKNPPIYVDNEGIMRWSDTDQEASFYGVNYSVPFAADGLNMCKEYLYPLFLYNLIQWRYAPTHKSNQD